MTDDLANQVASLIRAGRPGIAFDLARQQIDSLPASEASGLRLRYLMAHAAARGGNPNLAETILQPLVEQVEGHDTLPTVFQIDVLALMGNIFKHRSRKTLSCAVEAIRWYERASRVPGAEALPDGGTFPLINAATLHRIVGDRARATAQAVEVMERAVPRLAANPDDIWLNATVGEACVLLDRHPEASRHYLRAVDCARRHGKTGHILAMRANLKRLEDVGATAPIEVLDRYIGSVVVFSGHMIDAPGRDSVRLPPDHDLEAQLRTRIDDRLAKINATVGFSSLACGSDILFAEAMLDRQAELHIILPFSRSDFLRTSVTFGQIDEYWLSWQQRFERVLESVGADRVHFATQEPYLETLELFALANAMTQGLAVLRASERVTVPKALIVLDSSSEAKPGGARHFHDDWQAAGYAADVIDLQSLRGDTPASVLTQLAGSDPHRTSTPLPRSLKAILFADLQGFSKIPERGLAEFLTAYGSLLHDLFRSDLGRAARFANSWGDGLYVVFDQVPDAAAFAMALLSPTPLIGRGWPSLGLEDAPLRVALHYGPVFEQPDHFQARNNYHGQHVSRAARIEPVTMPGCIYVSEQFAAVLTLARGHRFRCEYVGQHDLAKAYDRCGLYQLLEE